MFRASPSSEPTAYQYNAQYNVQPTEDHEQIQDEIARGKIQYYQRRAPPSYRPTPLRWPFVSCLVVVLCAMVALIAYAIQSMPNSDSTAIFLPPEDDDLSSSSMLSARSTSIIRRAVAVTTNASSTAPTTTPASPSTTVSLPSSTTLPLGSTAGTQTLIGTPSSTRGTSRTSTVTPSVQTPSVSISAHPITSIASILTNHLSVPSGFIISNYTSTRVVEGSVVNTTSRITSTGFIVSNVVFVSVYTPPPLQGHLSFVQTVIQSVITSSVPPTTLQYFLNHVHTITSPSAPPQSSLTLSVPHQYLNSSFSRSSAQSSPPAYSTSTETVETTVGGTQTTVTVDITTSVPASFEATASAQEPTTFTVTSATTIPTESVIETTIASSYPPKTYIEIGVTVLKETITDKGPEQIAQPVTDIVTSVDQGETRLVVITHDPETDVRTVNQVVTGVETGGVETLVEKVVGGLTTMVITTQPQRIAQPVSVTMQTQVGGTVETVVQTQAPQRVVQTINGQETTMFSQPPPQTITRQVGGSFSDVVMVVTPTDGVAPVTMTVQSAVGGTLQTVVETPAAVQVVGTVNGQLTTFLSQPPPATIVRNVGGTLTDVVVVATASNGVFAPITVTGATMVGGTLTTIVNTRAPVDVVATVNGQLTTFQSQPPPETITTMIGGSISSFVSTILPSGSDLISYTIVATVSDQLTTIVKTHNPTTFLSTISGKLTTITSTPSPSSFLSTLSGTTRTMVSVSTPTVTSNVRVKETRFDLTNAEYFIGKFLSPLLAIALTIPLRIIDLNAKLYQPFHAMTKERGALGADSMTLQYTGLRGFITPIDSLLQGSPIPFVTTILVILSAFMVPLSTEAISLKVHGRCTQVRIEGCANKLGVTPGAAFALLAVLGSVIALLIALIVLLRRFKTGLYANPWSIAGIASLARSRTVRIRQRDEDAMKSSLAERRFGFGTSENDRGSEDYGIIVLDEDGHELRANDSDSDGDSLLYGDSVAAVGTATAAPGGRNTVPFISLGLAWRLLFGFLLLGFLCMVLYYHLTVLDVRNSLRNWLQSAQFGVRFLFAAIGVAICFAWESFFLSIATVSPFQRMAQSPQSPEGTILMSRPTNPFYGVYAAIRQGNPFLVLVATMAILAEFLPVLLANIPYNSTQTMLAHTICARTSIAILAVMVLTVLGSLAIRWPHMPVDPRSVAGAMWYVVESKKLLEGMEGVSSMSRADRERRVKEQGRRYYYGHVFYGENSTGTGPRVRLGVEADETSGFGDDTATAYNGAYNAPTGSGAIGAPGPAGYHAVGAGAGVAAMQNMPPPMEDTRGWTPPPQLPEFGQSSFGHRLDPIQESDLYDPPPPSQMHNYPPREEWRVDDPFAGSTTPAGAAAGAGAAASAAPAASRGLDTAGGSASGAGAAYGHVRHGSEDDGAIGTDETDNLMQMGREADLSMIHPALRGEASPGLGPAASAGGAGRMLHGDRQAM